MNPRLEPVLVSTVATLPRNVLIKLNITLERIKLIPMDNISHMIGRRDDTPIFIEHSHYNWERIYDALSAKDGKPQYFEMIPYYGFPLGSWDCPGSPWGKCVYYQKLDPAHDFCLYCGGPEERK